MKKVSVTLNKVLFSPQLNNEMIIEVLSSYPYDDKTGLGFTKVSIDDDVKGCLLKRTPTSLRTYNHETETFEENDIFIFEEIEFYIDLKNNFIYTFGTASKLNKVKSAIREYVTGKITYENIDFTIDRFLTKIELADWQYDIIDIGIKKFIYEDGAYGKYTAKITDQLVGRKLLEDNIDGISKITFNISHTELGDFELSIGTNNTMSVKCNEDDTLIIIDSIKKFIK